MKSVLRLNLPILALCLLLQNTCSAVIADGEFAMFGGKLYKKGAKYTIEAIEVKSLSSCGGELDKMIPAMAHVAEVGGNTVCFDLEGFNADGTELSTLGIESVKKVAERAKDQRMGTIVRVLGDSTDPAFRKNATLTAANTFKSELKAVYWFDGPEADKLASDFKAIAPKSVVIAPANGDLSIVTELPEKQPSPTTVVFGHIPTAYGNWDTHYILTGDEANYTALDTAKMTETEKNPPVFDASTLSEAEQKDGFTPIFNGKNLDGWWYFGSNHKTFKVNEAGEIEFVVTGGAAIQTAKRYDNFVLRLEWRINDGGNSGIFLRAPRAARQSKIGMEFQLHGDYGLAPNDDATGAIYKVVPALANASKPAKEWNDLEVVADGAHIKATMNGVVIQDLDLDVIPEMKHRLRKGFIGLQDHANWVSFRNIRIKELN